MIKISTRRHKLALALGLCAILLISMMLFSNGGLVNASGKKKFLKGFILGTLLAKNHYPVVYTMPSHHGGGGHGYGSGW